MKIVQIRYPILLAAVLTFLAAMWGGLLRMGWMFPALQPRWVVMHGPMMISGFLGTLIGIERAVALGPYIRKNIQILLVYLGPLLTGVAAVFSLLGLQPIIIPGLLFAGSLGLVGVNIFIFQKHKALDTAVVGLGALMWAVGNGLWLVGEMIPEIVMWWAGFLILTVAGERLELGRLVRLSTSSRILFVIILTVYSFGLLGDGDFFRVLIGLGLVGLALWLLRYDVAWKTIRKTGLPRFVAVCLLGSYVWLGISGVLFIQGNLGTAGLRYDAALHGIYIGFIMVMIFGHAPIIFPAVTGRPIGYHNGYYFPLGILHFSLLLRVGGDMLPNGLLRTWGGLLNVIAILIYFGLIVGTMIGGKNK